MKRASHLARTRRSEAIVGGVTMLWITPSEGNEHSWEEPSV